MIGLVGLDHRLAGAEVRGRFALAGPRLTAALSTLAQRQEIAGVAILSTCNRFEVYVSTPDWDAARAEALRFLAELYAARPVAVAKAASDAASNADSQPMAPTTTSETRPPEFEGELYGYEGIEAARHLLRVAAGLRSMVVGEAQILGQVKDAQLAAEQASTLDDELRALFTAANKAGKRVRAETELGRADASVARVAMRAADAALGGLAGKSVLLIGAGRTSQLCAELARDAGAARLLFANRTASVAEEVARAIGGEPTALHALPSHIPDVDLIVSATAAPHVMLTAATVAATLPSPQRPLVILDLAVPPDVEPAVGMLPGVTLHTIDTLGPQPIESQSTDVREPSLAQAERIVEDGLRDYARGQTLRLAVPGIAALRRHVDRSAQAELADALARLEHLSPEDRAIVSRLSQRLVDKMFHYLVVRVRSLAEYDEVPPQVTMQVLARLLADPDASRADGE
jgi:glutamyl-tRNA reductase